MNDADLLGVLDEAVDAVVAALAVRHDWGLTGDKPGQYGSDVIADIAASEVLAEAGLAVMSEESGFVGDPNAVVAVVDPIDGSTNASRGLPWFATSICALDAGGDGVMRAAVVHDHPGGRRFRAVRGSGAELDGRSLPRREAVALGEAVVAVNATPPANPGWAQFRTFGAAALELCGVAEGTFDGYVDFSRDGLGAWDYLGAMLVCSECGIEMVDAQGRDLVTITHSERRNPLAAPAPLIADLLAVHRSAT